MAKIYADMSDAEKNAYWELYYSTRDTLRFAIVDLDAAATTAQQSSTSSAILAEKLRLDSELVKLQNDSTAIAAGSSTITPPSAGEIELVKGFADRVDRFIATATTYQQVISIADEALKAYAKIYAA